jgi:hypothetical protein
LRKAITGNITSKELVVVGEIVDQYQPLIFLFITEIIRSLHHNPKPSSLKSGLIKGGRNLIISVIKRNIWTDKRWEEPYYFCNKKKYLD